MPALHAKTTTEQSPSAVRLSLIESGYWPVPVKGKRPHLRGWSKLHATAASVAAWDRGHPDHINTGILTGDVVAIDVDVQHADTAETIAGMVRALPGGNRALCRVGRAPKSLFIFRTAEPREKCKSGTYRIAGSKCEIEVLGTGQQFVGFGTHPETDAPYTWVGSSPLDVPFSDLPAIDTATVKAFLVDAEAILAAAGEPIKEAKQQRERNAGGTFWSQVNAAALAAPETWVKDLFSTAHLEAGTGAWRVSSKDLGRELDEDLSIHPDGIRDFGREKSATPIDLVGEFGGAPTPKAAADWLCGRLGKSPSEFGWQDRATVRIGFPVVLPVAANDDDDVIPEEPTTIGLPTNLTTVPGLVGDIADWIVRSGRKPSPTLALAAALAFVGGVAGRRYKGPTGLRTNVYVVTLAESGFGKDHPIAALRLLAATAGIADKFLGDDLASYQALRARLKNDPALIYLIDEFGKFLDRITSIKSGPHVTGISDDLLKLSMAARHTFGATDRAGEKGIAIQNPCVSIYGTGTGFSFWKALDSGNIDDGLLARFIIFDAGNNRPETVRKPEFDVEMPPEKLVKAVQDLTEHKGGNMSGIGAVGTRKVSPLLVPYADGADEMFETFASEMDARSTAAPPEHRPLWNRAAENALKLATIIAIGVNPHDPSISTDHVGWAIETAETSTAMLVGQAEDLIAENDNQREYKRIRTIVTKSGITGISRGNLARKLKGVMTRTRMHDVVDQLREAREIVAAGIKTDKGQLSARLYAANNVPPGATILTE